MQSASSSEASRRHTETRLYTPIIITSIHRHYFVRLRCVERSDGRAYATLMEVDSTFKYHNVAQN